MGTLSNVYKWIGKTLKLTDGDFWQAYYSGDTSTGKIVNAQTALQLSAVWSCVRLLSETVATLPLGLYERDDAGNKKPARNHRLHGILHDQPHANLTAVEFWEMVIAHVALWGNHFSVISRVGLAVSSLEPLHPEQISEVFTDENGRLKYKVERAGQVQTYDENEIFHVRGFGVAGLVGTSVIGMARQSFGLAIATEESAGKVFANGMQPSGFVEAPMVLKKEQRDAFRESLNDFTGSSNAGKTLLLEAGMQYKPLSMNPEDAQMLQTRAFNIEEVCRWFRVPPWMIGHTEKSTSWGTGLEQQMIAFLTFALRPYLARIEQAIRKSLLTPVERQRYFAEFNLEGLLRADSAGRAALYSQMAQNGIYTRNEIRSRENLPPIDGGDVLTVQSNLIAIDQLGKVTPTGGATNAQNQA